MSHVVTVAMEAIKHLKDLERACEVMQVIELKRNQKTFRTYGGRRDKCLHAISVIGNSEAYEIGVVKDGDNYKLQSDFYAGGMGLEAAVGMGAYKLKQEYAAQVSMRHLKKQGFSKIKRRVAESGNLVLVGER